MRSRKRARMMQPPRQIVAIAPRSSSQPYALGGRRHLLEALRVGDDLQAYSALRTSSTSSRSTRAPSPRLRAGEHAATPALAGRASADSERANTASVIAGQRHAEVERVLRRPAAGALLLGLVEDHVDQRLAGRGVASCRSTCAVISIRNESRSPSFHSSKTCAICRHLEPDAVAQQVVGLGDQLHVGVLDAVVDHLHVVARAVGADVGAARRAVDLGGDRGEDLLDLVVGLARRRRA